MFLQEKKRMLTLNPLPIQESPARVQVTMAGLSTVQKIMACKRIIK